MWIERKKEIKDYISDLCLCSNVDNGNFLYPDVSEIFPHAGAEAVTILSQELIGASILILGKESKL